MDTNTKYLPIDRYLSIYTINSLEIKDYFCIVCISRGLHCLHCIATIFYTYKLLSEIDPKMTASNYHAGPAVKRPEACHVLCHSEPWSPLHRSIAGVDVDHLCSWKALIAASSEALSDLVVFKGQSSAQWHPQNNPLLGMRTTSQFPSPLTYSDDLKPLKYLKSSEHPVKQDLHHYIAYLDSTSI